MDIMDNTTQKLELPTLHSIPSTTTISAFSILKGDWQPEKTTTKYTGSYGGQSQDTIDNENCGPTQPKEKSIVARLWSSLWGHGRKNMGRVKESKKPAVEELDPDVKVAAAMGWGLIR